MVSIEDIDHGFKSIVKEIKSFKNDYVKVGVLSDAGMSEDGKTGLVDVATFNEFGTSRIPPRPFMGQTFDKNKVEINRKIDEGFNAIVSGKEQAMPLLKKLGVWYKGEIQKIFTDGNFVPNAPSTLKQKSEKGRPLIDTGRLRQSIQFSVEST